MEQFSCKLFQTFNKKKKERNVSLFHFRELDRESKTEHFAKQRVFVLAYVKI